MHDNSVPISRVITGTLWTIAGLVLLAAWIVGSLVEHYVGVMLGITALFVTAAAAVAQIRCYSLRVCGMVRANQMPSIH